jgi:hypothetical protein
MTVIARFLILGVRENSVAQNPNVQHCKITDPESVFTGFHRIMGSGTDFKRQSYLYGIVRETLLDLCYVSQAMSLH